MIINAKSIQFFSNIHQKEVVGAVINLDFVGLIDITGTSALLIIYLAVTLILFDNESSSCLVIIMIKSESKQMIDARIKSIKECFKVNAGRSLKVKKKNDYDRIETLTVSPYSPVRTLKYTFVVNYEVK